MKAHVVNSQRGTEPTRLAFGLFDQEGAMIHDATALVRLYTLDGDKGTFVGEYDLTPRRLRNETEHKHGDGSTHVHDDPLATVYGANVDLQKTEWWGAELFATVNGKQHDAVRFRFFVSAHTTEPGIGEPAPRSTQPVLRNVADIAQIDSSTPPIPELHELTVAEALDRGKPVVIAFATPAFCQTRFCGPIIDQTMRPLLTRYQGRAEFVHIEPYRLDQARAGKLVPVPELDEWGLTTEPWVFVVDGKGKIAAKFEGVTTKEEVAAVLDRLLGAAR